MEAITPKYSIYSCAFSQAPPSFVHSSGAGSSEVGDAPYQALRKTVQQGLCCVILRGQASSPLPWALWKEGPHGNALEDEIGEQAVVSLLWAGWLWMTYPPRQSQCLEGHRPDWPVCGATWCLSQHGNGK